ncbi:unnamed protein product [Linum trigynum]|uniref:Uncharacterized protein n=1 Tax=Linum trigynum TaxID=586398 RepID=A0AAV2CF21_9ROSI
MKTAAASLPAGRIFHIPGGEINESACLSTAPRKQQQHTRFRWKGRAIFYHLEDTYQRFVMSVEDQEVYDKVNKRLHYELMSISRKLSQTTRRRRQLILQDKRSRRRSVVEVRLLCICMTLILVL